MANRRAFLTGLTASGLAPSLTWAEAGAPSFLSAARKKDGTFALIGLNSEATPVFSIPLPDRGHAATCHPKRPEAVIFARRPRTFALVLNCVTGTVAKNLTAPPERHFYGHGAFNRDGSMLFTTENAFELGEGRVGIWDASNGYRRIGEIWSGGIGPHDVKRIPGTDMLVVANGGIETHPDSGRIKLNLPTMLPNLTYLSAKGDIIEQASPEPELRLNSIRHLDVRRDGLVTFACQWQAETTQNLSLVGTHRSGEALSWITSANHLARPVYAGSISFNESGDAIGVTYPRSDGFAVYRLNDNGAGKWWGLPDACGIARHRSGFFVTTGLGEIGEATGDHVASVSVSSDAWDNHIVTLN